MRMDKKIVAVLALILTMAFTLAMFEPTFAAREEPKFTIKVSTREITGSEFIDIWLYVTNPSKDMETYYYGEGVGRWPVHNVTVNGLTVIFTYPNGTKETNPFVPPALHIPRECTPEPHPCPWAGLITSQKRWDRVVHPGETAIVYFGGWAGFPDPGKYQAVYILNITYEGKTYDLSQEFEFIVTE